MKYWKCRQCGHITPTLTNYKPTHECHACGRIDYLETTIWAD